MSHHVTCHVTAMSYTSSLSIKRKRNSKKIDKRKRKMLVSKAFHNTRNAIEFSRVRYKLIEAKIL